MNRRNTERLSADLHDLSSKQQQQQRIVRRKVHRSPSPQILRSDHREVRSASSGGSGDLYSRTGRHRPQKYDVVSYRQHSAEDGLRDDHHLGGGGGRSSSKDRGGGFGHSSRHHDGLGGGGGGEMRDRSDGGSKGRLDEGRSSHHHHHYDKFEYSLHVSNLNMRLTDGEAKTTLFREFKKYGFVNIKVIGFGKDRHAFINFTRLDDARAGLTEMNGSNFFGQNLEVSWSRSTLNRYPELGSSFNEHHSVGGVSSSSGSNKGHSSSSSAFQNDRALEFFSSHHSSSSGRNSDHHFQDSPHRGHSGSSSRDINFRNSSPPPTSSHLRNHSLGGGGGSIKDLSSAPVKGSSGAIMDPSATRTLFVGNLEANITERELRDLFSPYGRIECVDVKVQRSISTAYAFVKFFTIIDAINAKNDMHGRKYGNIKLKIGFAKGSPSAKVWVGNLSSVKDLSEIRSELDRFGLIRKIDHNNGDTHAIVHFDSLDAAQTAVSSLTTYRFRSTNRLLKIEINQPMRSTTSDFDDYDTEFRDSVTSNNRHVHSHISPEPSSHSMRGGGGGGDYHQHQHHRHHDEDIADHHHGISGGMKGGHPSSFRTNSRGRRVVTEVTGSTGTSSSSRRASEDNVLYLNERSGGGGGWRKRARSPHSGIGETHHTTNISGHHGNENHRGGGFSHHHHHMERSESTPNGAHHRIGGGGGSTATHHSSNGDIEYRPKRPRNSFDAYEYHKLHVHRSSMSERIGSSSYGGSLERDGGGSGSREREVRDRSGDDRDMRGSRDRDRRGTGSGRSSGGESSGASRRDRDGGGGREGMYTSSSSRSSGRDSNRRNSLQDGTSSSSSHRDGHASSSKLTTPTDSNITGADAAITSTNATTASGTAMGSEKDIEKVSPPPPPPTIMEMTSYETSDPALKLNDSSGPMSPTSAGQSAGMKPDFKVETLMDIARVYPVVWHGNLVLKNTGFPTRMHLIGGDPAVAELLVRCKDPKDETSDTLRITQRLRLEPARLEEVNKRMMSAGPSGHCILLALPGAIPPTSNFPLDENVDNSSNGSAMQLRPLKSLVSYLDQKEAAGIVALSSLELPTGQRENIIGVLHAFPPCEFSQTQLLRIAPNLGAEPSKEDHVVVLLVKGTV